jgi:CDP-6-deoxy-D-xylo-4-hexulose-3-dehydrase
MEQKGNRIKVPVSGPVTGVEEIEAVEQVMYAKQHSPGPKAEQFENDFAKFVGKRYGLFVNSGSSANLLAVTGFINVYPPQVWDVVLPAVLFPTTINPYLQNDYRVKVCDVDIETLQAVKGGNHGVHNLGNYSQLLGIEDSCDAMFPGRYNGIVQTFSFYPAHFISTGEGGMVTTDDKELYRAMKSIRDWGRDCWCKLGYDNTCGHRFTQQFGDMPQGYDHKYIYTRIGYNLSNTEMAAAIGVEQLKKLPTFLEIRKRHFARMYAHMEKYASVFILPKTVLPDTAWFGFPLTVNTDKFTRADIVKFLDEKGIGSRPIMTGNIKRQPAYMNHPRVVKYGALTNADKITESGFWVGCWHGLTDEQVEYTLEAFDEFLERY